MTVSRGTRIARISMTAELAQAIKIGLKSQTRRLINSGNSLTERSRFDEVDFNSAHTVVSGADISALSARASLLNGDRRTVAVHSIITPGLILWMKVNTASTQKQTPTLWVREVRAQRVNDISEADAIAEGVLGFGISLEEAYLKLLSYLAPRRRKAWTQSDLHATVQTRGAYARDCFALLWEGLHEPDAWRANGWVWVYKFVAIPYDVESTVSFAKSGALEAIAAAVLKHQQELGL